MENTALSGEIDEHVEYTIISKTSAVSQIQLNSPGQITLSLENELSIGTVQTTKWIYTPIILAESKAENVVAKEYLVEYCRFDGDSII